MSLFRKKARKRIISPFDDMSSMYLGWQLRRSVPFDKLFIVQTDREATMTYYLVSQHGLISSQFGLLDLPKNWTVA